MSASRKAPMPTEFHGVSIGDGRLRYRDIERPLTGVTVTVRDDTTTHREVTGSGLAQAAFAILATDQIDWTLSEEVREGVVVLVVTGPDFAFEVPVPAAERRAAKEFAVALRVAVKAA